MNILVTAGNTLAPIDRVRCLTNIFTGRTGAQIALHAYQRGHHVTLLTSQPDVVNELHQDNEVLNERWTVCRYRTFNDLQARMAELVGRPGFDTIVHCAAVSDYLVDGVFAPEPGTSFQPNERRWEGSPPSLANMAAGKVKSDASELWLRLVRAPKLIDRVRTDWNFHGILVKFKLEVGVGDERLLEIAEQSRRHSDADLMVANTLEGSAHWAYLGPLDGKYERVSRRELAARLVEVMERGNG